MPSNTNSDAVTAGRFNTEFSAYHYRRWLRQAETIQRKSETMLDDMINRLGIDDHFTDLIDDVLCPAETLCDALNRAIIARKSRAALAKARPSTGDAT